MKSVALVELTARRVELLDGLANGETFAVTDGGREIAALSPPRRADAPRNDADALALIADLVGIDDGPAEPYDKKKRLAGFGLDGPARRAAHDPSSPK